MKNLPLHFTCPKALDLDPLRNALANNHLPATVVQPDKSRTHLKVTPGIWTSPVELAAFVKGYLCGVDS